MTQGKRVCLQKLCDGKFPAQISDKIHLEDKKLTT